MHWNAMRSQKKSSRFRSRQVVAKQLPMNVIAVVVVVVVLSCDVIPHACAIEVQPYDGWFNNYAHHSWGASGMPYIRKLPSAYADGVHHPAGKSRPNPLEIARAAFGGSTGLPSYRNATVLMAFFGQHVMDEIVYTIPDTSCPPEYFNVPIPAGDPLYDPNAVGNREMTMLRDRYDDSTGYSPNSQREQLNDVTPYFDASVIYGPNKAWTSALRLFKDGLLAATNDSVGSSPVDSDRYFPAINDEGLPFVNMPPPRDHILKPATRFYKTGNLRGNEEPFVLTIGILWFRYHNYRARQLKANHPDWTDDQLFEAARKWIIAVYQKIVYYDWLPALLNEPTAPYMGYSQHVHPQISHVFQSAAANYGATLVPPGIFRRNNRCNFTMTTSATTFDGQQALRLCNTYWNPQEAVRESDIDELLLGMTSQLAEREDNVVTPDLHGYYYGPLEFSRRDLMALIIQRGRDHGLTDYNTARTFFGLPKVRFFDDINNSSDPLMKQAIRNMAKVYKERIDDVDIWPAAMLETTSDGPGPLLRAVFKDQFMRIRTADRFWFENYQMNNLFTAEEVDEIRNVTLREVILAVTDISPDSLQQNVFFHRSGDPCPQPFQVNESSVESCEPVKSYDYFLGSEVPYIFTYSCIFGSILPFLGMLVLWSYFHKLETKKQRTKLHDRHTRTEHNADENSIYAREWLGHKQGTRPVCLKLDVTKKTISLTENGRTVRRLELNQLLQLEDPQTVRLTKTNNSSENFLLIHVPVTYDIVLQFKNKEARDVTLQKLENFFINCGIRVDVQMHSKKDVKQKTVTRQMRDEKLRAFLINVFQQAEATNDGTNLMEQNFKLTKDEFADVLGLQIESTFVQQMFRVVDRHKTGLISYAEFLDFFTKFFRGSNHDKCELLFDMFNADQTETLSVDNLRKMLRSMVELANEKINPNVVDDLVNCVIARVEVAHGEPVSKRQILQFLAECQSSTTFQLPGHTLAVENTNKMPEAAPGQEQHKSNNGNDEFKAILQGNLSKAKIWWQFIHRYCEIYRRQILCLTIWTLVMFGIFIYYAYYYSVEFEHRGMRMVCGYGYSASRGSAYVVMYTYSSMLLVMCRNLITCLRETVLNRFIPFDSAVGMHKYIAIWSGVFTMSHVIAHGFNFYHLSTQTPSTLKCLLGNYAHPSDTLTTFADLYWSSLTGTTGALMTIHFILIYTSSVFYATKRLYRPFWIIHVTYPVFFILLALHSCGRMTQYPTFYYFLLGPVILFTIDKLISAGRHPTDVTVLSAELLPSDVTYLEMRKPLGFIYKSGQWVRIACPVRGRSEYHPFTISSAPHEPHLSVHIRAVGPWTCAVRRLYDQRRHDNDNLPCVLIDGPYGEGHQDWDQYEVSILIGGGIGVTPFSSILKDIAEKSSSGQRMICKKVYFIWVTRTQCSFEWMTDIIRQVEEKDASGFVTCQIYVTQFKEKFDLRTAMVYICEKSFKQAYGRSLVTGLRSETHFGRPDFNKIFAEIAFRHSATRVFGVFSCGPPPLTDSVEKACGHENKHTRRILLVHHHENI